MSALFSCFSLVLIIINLTFALSLNQPFHQTMTKALPILLIIITCLHTQSRANNNVDSLYDALCTAHGTDYDVANELMLMLDAEGCTDSLYHFDRHIKAPTVMKIVHLAMAGHYYEAEASMTATLRAARMAEKAARKDKDTTMLSEALAYQAVAAARMGRADIALAATKEELLLDSLSGQWANMSRAYNSLAGLCLQVGHLDDAMNYIEKAIIMERALPDSSHLSVRYGVAAEIYVKAGLSEQALYYAQRAYELDRQAGDTLKVARRLSQMADIYAERGDEAQAEMFYNRAAHILRESVEQKSLAINLKQQGQLFIRQGRLKEARTVLEECESICRKTDNLYTLQQVCRLLSELHTTSAPNKALAYLKEAFALNDSLHSERAQQLANELRKSQEEELDSTENNYVSDNSYAGAWLFALWILTFLGMGWYVLRQRKETTSSIPVNSATPKIPLATTPPTSQMVSLEFIAKVSELYESSLNGHRKSIDELAADVCMSRSQFTRKLTAATGVSANTFLNRIRLEKAERLLKDSEKSIATIAYECGFDDPAYFSNIFKKHYKVTPLQFRSLPQHT